MPAISDYNRIDEFYLPCTQFIATCANNTMRARLRDYSLLSIADTADPLVTATHAVFIGKGHKAPAAVVGLQFQHSSLATHFVNITSTVSVEFNVPSLISWTT